MVAEGEASVIFAKASGAGVFWAERTWELSDWLLLAIYKLLSPTPKVPNATTEAMLITAIFEEKTWLLRTRELNLAKKLFLYGAETSVKS